MRKAVDRATTIGAQSIQIFSDNPTAWRRRAEPSPEQAEFRARLAARDIRPVAIHASYLVNLPGPDDATYARSVGMLAGELARAWEYGASLVNVHIGSHRGSGVEVGLARLADGIGAALASAAKQLRESVDEQVQAGDAATESGPPIDMRIARLVLENSAGGGGGLGTTVREMGLIADRLADRGISRGDVGFCLDTAHAWGAGIDMSDPDAIDAFLAEFDERVGIDRLALVHLNDTRSELGSRTDRHEHLGAGRIGPVGLGHVVRHPMLAHAPAIIETPGMDVGYDRVNLARARALLHGNQLRPLPPAAFDLPGSARGRGAVTRGRATARTKSPWTGSDRGGDAATQRRRMPTT